MRVKKATPWHFYTAASRAGRARPAEYLAPWRGATRFGRREFGCPITQLQGKLYASYEADDIIPELRSQAGPPTVPRGKPANKIR